MARVSSLSLFSRWPVWPDKAQTGALSGCRSMREPIRKQLVVRSTGFALSKSLAYLIMRKTIFKPATSKFVLELTEFAPPPKFELYLRLYYFPRARKKIQAFQVSRVECHESTLLGVLLQHPRFKSGASSRDQSLCVTWK